MSNVTRRILIAEDDQGERELLSLLLQEWGYKVEAARDGHEALLKAERFRPAIVISDVIMARMDGLALLRALKEKLPNCEVILITAQAMVDSAVRAIKEGATDYIEKPIKHDKLKRLIESIFERIGWLFEAEEQLANHGSFGRLVGTSNAMCQVYELIKRVVRSAVPLFISGERGTGKELVARTIYELSERRDKPFIAINSAAIPETLIESEIFGHEKGAFTGALETRIGCFEMANKGTLFFDEIAEMPINLQPKLLRVLEDNRVRRLGGRQEIEVDVRVIAATNRDPQEAIKAGQLREDLYDRLNVFHIKLPPLRERTEDIPLLVRHFINELNRKHDLQIKSITPQAVSLLMRYSWPGNVRELRNLIERTMILCKGETINTEHFPTDLQNVREGPSNELSVPFPTSLHEAEKLLILKTLEMTGRNKAEAARILEVDVKTIRNKLKSYGISDEESAAEG